MDNKIKKVCPGVLTNFPFLEDQFDSITEYEMICTLAGQLNQVIDVVNGDFTTAIEDYIAQRFEDIIMKADYDETNQALLVSLESEG